jgi:peptidyl-tRNA hydrolase
MITELDTLKKIISHVSVIIGIGNPGSAYDDTPHNIGKDFLSYCFENQNFQTKPNYSYIHYNNKIFIRSDSLFMNHSGKLFSVLIKDNVINKISKILIINDDAQELIGNAKIRYDANRGHRGHNGLRDIIKTVKEINIELPYFLSLGILPEGYKKTPELLDKIVCTKFIKNKEIYGDDAAENKRKEVFEELKKIFI